MMAALPAFFIREHPVSRVFFVLFWIIEVSSLILFRLFLRYALKYIGSYGYRFRQILVVGRNARSAKLLREIEDLPNRGIRLLGIIDAPNEQAVPDPLKNYAVLGDLTELEVVLRSQIVDEVFLMLPIKSFYAEIEGILQLCEAVGVEVKLPTDIFNLKTARSSISYYGDIPLINLYTSPTMNLPLLTKRFLDLSLSLLALLLLFPVFLVIGILIRTSSPGPILYKQDRLGYNGRRFKCLKFRTMTENADAHQENLWDYNEMDGPVFKMRNDPRITRLGRGLRRYSLDELPQLINVLKGDMSLVGPRPSVPGEVSQYRAPPSEKTEYETGNYLSLASERPQ